MAGETRWWKYGPCEDCEAEAGRPCRDLRFAANRDRTSHVIPADRPHPGRHVKGYLPRQPQEARHGR